MTARLHRLANGVRVVCDPMPDLETLAVSVVPFFTGSAGGVYLAGAAVLGIGLVAITVLDLEGRRWTRRLWTYSMVYLALLFLLFAASPFLP